MYRQIRGLPSIASRKPGRGRHDPRRPHLAPMPSCYAFAFAPRPRPDRRRPDRRNRRPHRLCRSGPRRAVRHLDAKERIDCAGRWITPGLIDCHTHLVYGGNPAPTSSSSGWRARELRRDRARRRRHRLDRESDAAGERRPTCRGQPAPARRLDRRGSPPSRSSPAMASSSTPNAARQLRVAPALQQRTRGGRSNDVSRCPYRPP